jgi:hypothetical protein
VEKPRLYLENTNFALEDAYRCLSLVYQWEEDIQVAAVSAKWDRIRRDYFLFI